MPHPQTALPPTSQTGAQQGADPWGEFLTLAAWAVGGLLVIRWIEGLQADKRYCEAVEFAWVPDHLRDLQQ